MNYTQRNTKPTRGQRLKNWFIPTKETPEPNRALTLLRFQTQRLSGMDILTWKEAIEAAASAVTPRWYKLQDMYDSCMLDGHLHGVLEKRRLNIVLSELVYQDANGEPIEQVNKMFSNSRWYEFLAAMMDARFRGYTMVQFKVGADGGFDFDLMPWRHVLPGNPPMLLKNYTDHTGVDMTAPEWADTVAMIDTKGLGLLSVVSQYVIMKRNTLADNAQYLEQYAMPIQGITYKGNDPNVKDQVKAMVDNRGSNAMMTLPEDLDAKLLQGSTSSSNDAYKGFLDRMDEQISKAVLGQTMTTDNGSSQSQATVHKEVNDKIDKADRMWATMWLNEQFSKFMPLWGVQPSGVWVFNEDASETLKEQIENDILLKGLIPDADPAHFAKKYQIPRLGTSEPV